VRPIPPDSWTAGALAGTPVHVAEDEWLGSPRGRVVTTVAAARLGARRRRWPRRSDRAAVARAASRRFLSRYWSRNGGALLRRASLLHLVGPPLPFVVDAMLAARAAGLPIIYQSVHDVSGEYATHKWRRGFIDTCNACDLILTTHDAQAADFAENFHYRGATTTVPQWAYGVERELLAIPVSDRSVATTIGTLTRLDPVKRVDVLIEAFAAVAADDPVPRLRIGGAGSAASDLRDLVSARGIVDRVELTGYVGDRADFYRGVDVFAITSDHEGGPVTGVEAMAAGRAVVSTPVGAMPERLADGAGALVAAGDVESLSAELRALTSVPGRAAELGAAGRARYLERYREDLSKRRLLDVWTRAMERSDGRHLRTGGTGP
jgi:glycosyltransferase involved in cell wall biosynthesis